MPLTLAPYMEQLTIVKKELQVEPIRFSEPFSWAQRALVRQVERRHNAGLPVRIIVLKGRQLGVSTITEGLLFHWCFLYPGSSSLVIAHETKASRHLFEMTKLMWETWPYRTCYTEKHNSQKTLSWIETRSSMEVATARNVGSGRSFTYHAVHCSECAFWEEPEPLMAGLNQTVPYKHGTAIIIESTANGVGNWYYEEWQRAVNGQSNFVPMFFPWFKHIEYQIPITTLTQAELLPEEVELQQLYSLTFPQLAWRRFAIENLCLSDPDIFKQEYPCSPREAFLSTGRNVFPLVRLQECFEPRRGIRGFLSVQQGRVVFTSDPTGPLTIYREPADRKDWGMYVVAGDPARTVYGDPACIQVLNRRTFEQVAVWHGYLSAVPFAQQIALLGRFYNDALVNCEINGPGYATIGALLESGYPNVWRHRWADKAPGKLAITYGWEMSYKRKHLAVAAVINLLAKRALTLHDSVTYDEMKDYVVLEFGEMGPPSRQGHDDAVTSYLIAVCTSVWADELPYPQDDPHSLNLDWGGIVAPEVVDTPQPYQTALDAVSLLD